MWKVWLFALLWESYFSPSPPPDPRLLCRDRGCCNKPIASGRRSPEQSKASAGSGSDSCIEPVSPPDGVGEPEHAKSTAYPVLYREGEQIDQR